MILHKQFDLNLELLKVDSFNDIPRAINEVPILVENVVKGLLERGYTVIESSADYMGIPKSITVIKEFTGPFVSIFATKINEDFESVSEALGIKKLFV